MSFAKAFNAQENSILCSQFAFFPKQNQFYPFHNIMSISIAPLDKLSLANLERNTNCRLIGASRKAEKPSNRNSTKTRVMSRSRRWSKPKEG